MPMSHAQSSRRAPVLPLSATLLACAALPAMAQSGNVQVPGTANPWLAGMPNGSVAGGNDTAPEESPVLVPFAIRSGAALRFTAAGGTTGSASGSSCPPEGCGSGQVCDPAQNGIAGACWSVTSGLVGVFMDSTQPDLSPAPADLDFSVPGAMDFSTLVPELKQVFYIGDGENSDGRIQVFTAPQGATRLFLGTIDGNGWFNNVGAFSVTVSETGGAETCYPNCDQSTTAPILNVGDFTCFLQKYASADSYANCDQSTQPPILNVQDFSCFLTKYAAGCP